MSRNFLISSFIFICLCADIKGLLPTYIHWAAWAILIFPLMVRDLFQKGIVKSPFLFTATMVFFIGCLTTIFNAPNMETIVQLVKFMLIIFTLYYFLYYYSFKWKLVYYTLNFTVIVNVLLLIVGLLGISEEAAQLMTGDGRWGTMLAYPGSLVKIGTYAFYINILSLFFRKDGNKFVQLFFLLLSFFIIFMDGSRTGMLLIVATTLLIPVFYSLIYYRNKIKFLLYPTILFLTFVLVVLVSIPYLQSTRIGSSIQNILQSESLTEGLAKMDSSRFGMLLTALENILQNPFIGTGAFSTQLTEYNMVVHNTYLQYWGDYGLLGIVAMICIYFGWIVLLPKVMESLMNRPPDEETALVCSSILMLIYYDVNGLFHPYSTEYPEWILFIFAISIYYNFYRKRLN